MLDHLSFKISALSLLLKMLECIYIRHYCVCQKYMRILDPEVALHSYREMVASTAEVETVANT